MQVMNETQKVKVKEIPLVKYSLELNPKDDYKRAVHAFLHNKVGRFGKYFALPNALLFRNIITDRGYGQKRLAQNIIARRIETETDSFIIGNSSILPLVGRRVSFGNETMNRDVTPIQEYLSTRIQMIPFSVFDEACLDLSKYRLLDRGQESTVTRQIENPEYVSWEHEKMLKKGIPKFIDETVHFTGASLFEVDGSTFLFDIDQEEIKHKIFNAFLVKIPTNAKTIDQAYLDLKPQEVIDAENQGLKVERQGEWFFIPIDKSTATEMQSNLSSDEIFLGKLNEQGHVDLLRNRSFKLKAGPNRPNYAQNGFTFNEKAYVSGLVEHSGREHRAVNLEQWCYAIPNTATESFTIVGDVD